MLSRRSFSCALGLCAATGGVARAQTTQGLTEAFRRIDAESGGRFGIAVQGPFGQASMRGDERFPLCSTFKVLASAALLAHVDAGTDAIERRVVFDAASVVANSPVTEHRTGGEGMTLSDICEAAITRSDNTAGNLILAAIGGPAALTDFARRIGDPVTRLDRIEPDLNEAKAGDARDTTTPLAMLANLRALVLGKVLAPASRERLVSWLVGNKTGDARLRAGFPNGWRIGDKTGTGENGATNDLAIVWPSDGPPILIAAYLTETPAPFAERNAMFATLARTVFERL